MPRQDAIELEARVIELLPRTMFRVELANGHTLLGHVAAEERGACNHLLLGDKVMLQVSPYDLSRGRIIPPAAARS